MIENKNSHFKNFLQLSVIMLSVCTLFNIHSTPIHADNISPAIININAQRNNTYTGQIDYTNTSDTVNTYKVEVAKINPENNSIDYNEDVYTSVSIKEFTLEQNENISIKYIIEIPELLSAGSYFDVVNIIKKSSATNSINVNTGLGTIIAIHVEDDADSISKSIQDKTVSTVKLVNTGDLLNPITITWTFQNNSNYVLKPKLNVLYKEDSNKSQPISFSNSESDNFTSYPGKAVTKEVKIPLWKITTFYKKYNIYFETSINQEVKNNSLSVKLIDDSSMRIVLATFGVILFLFVVVGLPLKIKQNRLKRQGTFKT
jgi:uncharacterized protein YaaQ